MSQPKKSFRQSYGRQLINTLKDTPDEGGERKQAWRPPLDDDEFGFSKDPGAAFDANKRSPDSKKFTQISPKSFYSSSPNNHIPFFGGIQPLAVSTPRKVNHENDPFNVTKPSSSSRDSLRSVPSTLRHKTTENVLINNGRLSSSPSSSYLSSPRYSSFSTQPANNSASGYRGMRNMGNTCYLNATLQALLAITPFETDILSLVSRQSTPLLRALSQVANLKKGLAFTSSSSSSPSSSNSSYYHMQGPIDPSNVKNALSAYKGHFSGSQQEDAHEFLVAFLDTLQTEIRKTLPKESIDPVALNFDSLLEQNISCLDCDHVGDPSRSIFRDFSLALPSKAFDATMSLQTLFDLYLEPYALEYKCESCAKIKGSSLITSRVKRPPRTLILQLKRFAFEGETRVKLSTPVNVNISITLGGAFLADHADPPYTWSCPPSNSKPEKDSLTPPANKSPLKFFSPASIPSPSSTPAPASSTLSSGSNLRLSDLKGASSHSTPENINRHPKEGHVFEIDESLINSPPSAKPVTKRPLEFQQEGKRRKLDQDRNMASPVLIVDEGEDERKVDDYEKDLGFADQSIDQAMIEFEEGMLEDSANPPGTKSPRPSLPLSVPSKTSTTKQPSLTSSSAFGVSHNKISKLTSYSSPKTYGNSNTSISSTPFDGYLSTSLKCPSPPRRKETPANTRNNNDVLFKKYIHQKNKPDCEEDELNRALALSLSEAEMATRKEAQRDSEDTALEEALRISLLESNGHESENLDSEELFHLDTPPSSLSVSSWQKNELSSPHKPSQRAVLDLFDGNEVENQDQDVKVVSQTDTPRPFKTHPAPAGVLNGAQYELEIVEDEPPCSSSSSTPSQSKRTPVSSVLTAPPTYRLAAVIRHMGSAYSGHYVCDAFDSASKKWLTFNDSQVSPTDESSVLHKARDQGYIFFYVLPPSNS